MSIPITVAKKKSNIHECSAEKQKKRHKDVNVVGLGVFFTQNNKSLLLVNGILFLAELAALLGDLP